MRKVLVTIVACMLMTGVFVGVSHATLIDLDDVDGKGYFKDSETQMIWMDLDNFFGMTYGEAHAMLDGTGFSLATHAQMATLEAYIGASDLLVGGSDQLMLGSSPESPLVWGWMDDGVDIPGAQSWYQMAGFQDHWPAEADLAADTQAFATLGAWAVGGAYPGQAAVPEPASLMLLGVGLLGLMALRRKVSHKR